MYASKLLLEQRANVLAPCNSLKLFHHESLSFSGSYFLFKNCTMAIKVKVVGISVLWAAAYAYLKTCLAAATYIRRSLFNNNISRSVVGTFCGE